MLKKAAKSLGKGQTMSGHSLVFQHLRMKKSAIKKILDKWGKLDVVVANAGVGPFAPVSQISRRPLA